MGKFRAIKKLGTISIGLGAGAAVGVFRGMPGERSSAVVEGALLGGALGGAAAFARPLVKVGTRIVKSEAKHASRVAKVMGKRKGQVIFRRIRGRLVPIRAKK